jgi:hypothetical protein
MLDFGELERIGEDAAVTYFKVILRPFPGRTEEFQEEPSSG